MQRYCQSLLFSSLISFLKNQTLNINSFYKRLQLKRSVAWIAAQWSLRPSQGHNQYPPSTILFPISLPLLETHYIAMFNIWNSKNIVKVSVDSRRQQTIDPFLVCFIVTFRSIFIFVKVKSGFRAIKLWVESKLLFPALTDSWFEPFGFLCTSFDDTLLLSRVDTDSRFILSHGLFFFHLFLFIPMQLSFELLNFFF